MLIRKHLTPIMVTVGKNPTTHICSVLNVQTTIVLPMGNLLLDLLLVAPTIAVMDLWGIMNIHNTGQLALQGSFSITTLVENGLTAWNLSMVKIEDILELCREFYN